MNKFFDNINMPAYQQLVCDTRSDNFTTAFGVHKNEKCLLLANIDRPVVYVTADYVAAQSMVRSVNALGKNYMYLPHIEDTLMYTDKVGTAVRNNVLYNISVGNIDGIVVGVESLMQYLPTVQYINSTIKLNKGMDMSPAKLMTQLVDMGYTRVESLDGDGQVVVRGDIVELYMLGNRYRIDYWGDTIDDMVLVNQDLTGTSNIDSITIVPITATIGSNDNTITRLGAVSKSHKLDNNAQSSLDTIMSRLEQQCHAGKCFNNWIAPLLDRHTLSQYLADNTVVVWDEPRLIADRVNFLYGEQDTRLASLIGGGQALPMHSNMLVDRFKIYANYSHLAQCSVQSMTYGGTFFNSNSITRVATSGMSSYHANVDNITRDINMWLEQNYQVVIMAGDDQGCTATRQQLLERGINCTSDYDAYNGNSALILSLDIQYGFVSHSNKLAVVGSRELGRSSNKRITNVNKKSTFLSIDKGDYVVHEYHGIGLYEGIQRINDGGKTKDYLAVLYKNGDRLLVPAEGSSSITRYSGGQNPKLSKIGGKDFDKLKNKVRESVKEMSINLVELYASRQKPRGFRYTIDSYLQQQFADDFGYVETADQQRSINEVYEDLSKDKIMDRVLVGDVGFGKTEVAMRAVFAVVSNGYQCAVLAPTTILSEQHYENFAKRLGKFNIKVACLNRFRTAQQMKDILSAVRKGEIDVVIGTHKLLGKDVKFANLALMVLDEEQRFGVEHKEKIKSIKNSIDVLTLSATPIPRTLHMALSGIRDISTIATAPLIRQPVDTHVVESNDSLVRDIIMREINRGGQVFVVYNRVENIDIMAGNLAQLVPEANIVVAHGQMSEHNLEQAVVSFLQGDNNVLLCSTIIENGINMPNANTIIVYDSDKLGLSQLYQLRGRVGRADKLAFAYFMYQEGKVLSSVAYKRLTSITEYTQLGSGFKIAMKDLEIRGAGNILGREQHGHMVKVGYDMYSKILAETVSAAVGNSVDTFKDTEMIVDIDAYAPEDYIVSTDERMQIYQQISSCSSVEQVDDMHKQILEVYGDIPQPLINLLIIAKLRVYASKALVAKLVVKGNSVQIIFDSRQDMFRQSVVDAVVSSGQVANFAHTGYAIDIVDNKLSNKYQLMAYTQDFLIGIADNEKIVG